MAYSGASGVFRNAALKVALNGATYDVKASANGRVWSAHMSNLDAAGAWLNVYDATDHTQVVAGTTPPVASFRVASSGDRSVVFGKGFGFVNGCVVTFTTADGGAAAGSSGGSVTIEFE